MLGTSFPSINSLNITEFGVFKLLDKIDVSKDSGPDCIPGRILQDLARELAPALHYTFDQSLYSGDLPADWTLANVAPIFKKGSKLQAVNYRPVSLTCITCKLFEHIVCKNILGHLEEHGILTNLQYGFRTGTSCETQLITTFHDIASAYNKKGSQIDMAISDFSKAFYTVSHDSLLSKLKHYSIDDKIWTWISNFRKQRVVVDGIQSESDLVTVDSGVPQGTVLSPILFLLQINDLLEEVKGAKYLGVTLSDDLELTKHIDVITSKANSKLSFLRRNLKGCPEKLRETAYFSLVRSFLEYSATDWHPRQTGDGAAKGCSFCERQVWNV